MVVHHKFRNFQRIKVWSTWWIIKKHTPNSTVKGRSDIDPYISLRWYTVPLQTTTIERSQMSVLFWSSLQTLRVIIRRWCSNSMHLALIWTLQKKDLYTHPFRSKYCGNLRRQSDSSFKYTSVRTTKKFTQDKRQYHVEDLQGEKKTDNR
jgi:hypothetical protein